MKMSVNIYYLELMFIFQNEKTKWLKIKPRN